MKNQEKIYIGKSFRFIIEQTIGRGKILDALKAKYNVEVFDTNGEIIVLVGEKQEEAKEYKKVELTKNK